MKKVEPLVEEDTVKQKETLLAKFPSHGEMILNTRSLWEKLGLSSEHSLTSRLTVLYKKFDLGGNQGDKAIELQEYLNRQYEGYGNLWQREFDTGGINQLLNTTVDENNLPDRVDLGRSIVIGISGGSCSGKTWLSHQFQKLCPVSVCVFDLDGYYKDINDVMKEEHTHDNPNSINFDHALFDLAQLKAGRAVRIPKYNFVSQQQEGSRLCTPTSIILVEGIFSFSKPRFLQEFDFKVWVEADDVTRYQRRLNRDVAERGRDPLEIEQRYDRNVIPGYQKFIYPNKRVADITIHNDTNSDSIPEGLYALIAYCLLDKSIFNKKA